MRNYPINYVYWQPKKKLMCPASSTVLPRRLEQGGLRNRGHDCEPELWGCFVWIHKRLREPFFSFCCQILLSSTDSLIELRKTCSHRRSVSGGAKKWSFSRLPSDTSGPQRVEVESAPDPREMHAGRAAARVVAGAAVRAVRDRDT